MKRLPLVVLIVSLVFLFSPLSLSAQESKKDLPERAILIAPEFYGIEINKDEPVSLDVSLINRGKKDEFVELSISELPENWKAYFKTFTFGVNGVFLKGDSSKSITLKAEPNKGVKPGLYAFKVKATTKDKAITSTADVSIKIKAKEEGKEAEGIVINSSYPVLRGPSDARFEFNIEVENKEDREVVYNLSYEAPENWEVNFKPGYEEKFISSIRLKENQLRNVAVEVRPSPLTPPGEYPVKVKVESPNAKGNITLTVNITGVHKMEVGTTNELLSLTALRGNKTSMSFYIKNTGTAPLTNIQFLSIKPEAWKVEFQPEKIENLNPNEIKQAEVIITASESAIVGDYSVGLNVDAGKVNKNLELRVTVKAKP
ncbi:MAG: NEW3 domain-containing protein, partial [Desulfatiglandales bacterium]